MSRRLIVAGPRAAVAVWATLPGDDVVRLGSIAPIDLLRTVTPRDEILLLDGWELDRDTCRLAVVGLWLKLRFHRVEYLQLVEYAPTSPTLDFAHVMSGVTA